MTAKTSAETVIDMDPLQRAEDLKAEATAAYKRHEFDEAEAKYREAYELTPTNLLLLNNIAAVYLEKGEYDKCLEITDQALAKRYDVKADYTTVAKIYARRAVCFVNMQNYPNAIEAYKKSLMEDNTAKTRSALRETERMYLKHQQEQYIDLEKAEEHRQKGNTFFKIQQYPEAKAEYDEAIKRNPKDAKLWTNRAAAYVQLFEYPSALKDCEKAIALDPNFAKAYGRMGTCYYKMKDYNKALTAYQNAMRLDPDNSEYQKGCSNVMMTVREQCHKGERDPEAEARALADPEIQSIIGDPQMQLILRNIQNDPDQLRNYIRDPKIAQALEKLMTVGILRVA